MFCLHVYVPGTCGARWGCWTPRIIDSCKPPCILGLECVSSARRANVLSTDTSFQRLKPFSSQHFYYTHVAICSSGHIMFICIGGHSWQNLLDSLALDLRANHTSWDHLLHGLELNSPPFALLPVTCSLWSEQRLLIPKPSLKLHTFMSCLLQMQGPELRSSDRALRAPSLLSSTSHLTF